MNAKIGEKAVTLKAADILNLPDQGFQTQASRQTLLGFKEAAEHRCNLGLTYGKYWSKSQVYKRRQTKLVVERKRDDF